MAAQLREGIAQVESRRSFKLAFSAKEDEIRKAAMERQQLTHALDLARSGAESLQKALAREKEKCSEAIAKVDAKDSEILSALSRQKVMETSLAEAKSENAKLESSRKRAQEELAASRQRFEADIALAREESRATRAELSDNQSKLEESTAALEQARSRLSATEDTLARVQSELKANQASLEHARAALNDAVKRVLRRYRNARLSRKAVKLRLQKVTLSGAHHLA